MHDFETSCTNCRIYREYKKDNVDCFFMPADATEKCKDTTAATEALTLLSEQCEVYVDDATPGKCCDSAGTIGAFATVVASPATSSEFCGLCVLFVFKNTFFFKLKLRTFFSASSLIFFLHYELPVTFFGTSRSTYKTRRQLRTTETTMQYTKKYSVLPNPPP